MKDQRIVMGMPVTVEIVGSGAADIDDVFAYFTHIEEIFSPFGETSETSRINQGAVHPADYSDEMRTVMRLAAKAKAETDGYFDVYRNGVFNPVGVVKGWAIHNAAQMLRDRGLWDFYIEAGGDIQLSGLNEQGTFWAVGIRNPFNAREIVKVVYLSDIGIATSGTYVRGDHIYDPHTSEEQPIADVVSLSVIGPNVCDADVYTTAAFAMGHNGISFIEEQDCFEGYLIDKDGTATLTSGFADHTIERPFGRTKGVAA